MFKPKKHLVWLGIALVAIGLACSPLDLVATQNSSSTPASSVSVPAASPGERMVSIDALYFLSGTPATGGMSAVQVTVRRSPQPGQMRVGFFEQEVGGTGPQWHASGWEAALVGAFARGVDPSDYEFSFNVGGRIDGPSAGTLMTVGVIAALRGDTVRPDASMTGTINPDGTVGPVGGIPHKLDGAAKKGKKLILIPIGQRFSLDFNTNQNVDVIELGKTLGVDVREVGNLYDAYALLTGKTLPRYSTTPSAPQMPSRAFERYRAKTNEWYSRYQKERNQYTSFSAEMQKYLADYVKDADYWANKANADLQQGLSSVAYFDEWDAATKMRKANSRAAVVDRYNSTGFQGALNYVQSLAAVQNELNAVVDQFQTLDPKTVSDVSALFDAYSELGAAQGTIIQANNNLAIVSKNAANYTRDQAIDELAWVASQYIDASDSVQLGRDAIDIEMGFGKTAAPPSNQVMRVAESLRRVAEANLALFDATIISDYAKKQNATMDSMRAGFLDKDGDYQVAYYAGVSTQTLTQRTGNGPKSAPMVFGNAQNGYAFSSAVIAKYYSLSAELDNDLNVVSFRYGKALGEMLDSADQRAKELTSLCGDDVPIAAIMYYENARAYSRGTPGDQLIALNYFWQASALAQANAFMSGKITPR